MILYCILDIGSALILIFSILNGRKKGAIRMLISAFGVIVAFVLAFFVSSASDQYIYEKFVQPRVIESIEDNIRKASEETINENTLTDILEVAGTMLTPDDAKEFRQILEEDPELLTNDEFRDKLNSELIGYKDAVMASLSDILPESMMGKAEEIFDKVISDSEYVPEIFSHTEIAPAAETIERETVRPIAMDIVRTVMFFAVYILVMVIFSIVSWAVRAVHEIPVISGVDSIAGSILGIIRAAAYLIVICLVVRIVIQFNDDSGKYINSAEVSKTVLFKWIYYGIFFVMSLIMK